MLGELLNCFVFLIINENDFIFLEELMFGDNDMLLVLVSGFVLVDMFMIFMDVNGLYDKNFQKNVDVKKYYFFFEVMEEIFFFVGDVGLKFGIGGMKLKIDVVKIVFFFGVSVFIGIGCGQEKFVNVLKGKGDGMYVGNVF